MFIDCKLLSKKDSVVRTRVDATAYGKQVTLSSCYSIKSTFSDNAIE